MTQLMLAVGVAALGLALVGMAVRWVGASALRFRALVLVATGLTFALVVVGAYVRLSDAGLGCPDWPGCYGQAAVPSDGVERARANAAYPNVPLETAKAWKEMGHRYLAGILGLAIAAIAVIAWLRRGAWGQSPWLATSLVALVALQATLGMWTVTLLLKPVIVTLHLAGGMATLALLTWLAMRPFAPPPAGTRALRVQALGALLLVSVQILLGGWVSSNYAALACTEFPACRAGVWLPSMDFANAFHVVRELGMTAGGALLPSEALTAIHWMHRVGAVVVAGYILVFAMQLARHGALRSLAWLLAAAVLVQFALGVLNVWWSLPLALAAAHTAGAAALLVIVVVINFRIRAAPQAWNARLSPAPS
jgi:cytochrome c oxidase assembly protein subunit 15